MTNLPKLIMGLRIMEWRKKLLLGETCSLNRLCPTGSSIADGTLVTQPF